MLPIERELGREVRAAARAFGAVVVTGLRRSGKTYLLQRLFPRAAHVLSEDSDVIARFESDPQGFLESLTPPVILDEVQNVSALFNYVRSRIDATPTRKGRRLMTGSQEAALMKNVSESMAGRAAILRLLPWSIARP